LPQGLLLDEKKTKSSIEEQFNRIDARHRKKKKRQEKYSWMSLGWLRFFGTSVNKEEKENSCGLRAEKFFARTKHSSSRLHSSWSKDNVLPVNHANDVGRVQEIRKIRIFGTCRILDWMRKFNFLDDEKVTREKGKIEAGHRTSPLHKHFFSAHLYSNVSPGLLNYQDSRYTTSSASSSAMERSIEKLSILSLKTSVSAGHSALQNAGRKKKIRLWSTLFSSSTSKMIHVIK
jgi:hypothetical protein